MARSQRQDRAAGLVVCAVMALLFTSLGLVAGLRPLARTLTLAWQSSGWTQVPAWIDEQALSMDDDGLRHLRVLYHYEWQGQRYLANRVGVNAPDLASSRDEALPALAQRLAQAQARREPVPAWVDPQAPHRAVLDRQLSPRGVLLHLPFALVFTGAGLGAGWLFVHLWRSPPVRRRASSGSDDLPIRVSVVLAVFGLFWCGLSLPLTTLMWLDGPGWGSGLFGLLFNGAGLYLLHLAWRSRDGRRPVPSPSPPRPRSAPAIAAAPAGRARRIARAVALGAALAVGMVTWQLMRPASAPAAGSSTETTPPTDGDSALMAAARSGDLAELDRLLAQGADPQQANLSSDSNRGDTALLIALFSGQEAAYRRLLAAGARLDVKNRWDWGPVHMAAQGGCVPCLADLAERGLPLHEPAPASLGETPAMLAAARGRVDALAWLVAHGADLHHRDAQGHDALAYARFKRQAATEAWIKAQLQTL